MEKKYITLLYSEKVHDIKEFETLKEAITYLIKNGANFENQEIVNKVDWMPDNVKSTTDAQVHKLTPEEEELAKRPNPTTPPLDQPKIIDPLRGTNLQGKKSIFDGIIPPQMRGVINKDD